MTENGEQGATATRTIAPTDGSWNRSIPQGYRLSLVKLEGKDAQQMLKLMEALDDHDDVQHVWANFDIEEKEIEASLA